MKALGKLKGRGGFSLAEMLVTLVILSMLSSVACMGITIALQNRAKAITVADAQTVASTAAQAVSDQVRYGQIVNVGADYIELTGNTYGSKVKLCLDGGRLVARNASGTDYALLGEKAYSNLTVDDLTFTPDVSGGEVKSVDIHLSVAGIWSLDWTVAPLNPYMGS